ncbi:hypothetical protein PGT21_030345 [Puccinia graminis f. sp. tritici]|nr:hypothetical protein PGT21_030345 [Puccinia graminis f. sp. tritici]
MPSRRGRPRHINPTSSPHKNRLAGSATAQADGPGARTRSRSGKTILAPVISLGKFPAVRDSTRRRQQTESSPATPSPVGAGRKRKVTIADSDHSEPEISGRPTRRPRHGRLPAHEADPPTRQKDSELTDYATTGVGADRRPPVVNFPWAFTIPIAQGGISKRHHAHFDRVEDSHLKSILQRVGCSVVGKNRAQLIEMAVAYGPLSVTNSTNPAASNSQPPRNGHAAHVSSEAFQGASNTERAPKGSTVSNAVDLIELSASQQDPTLSNRNQTRSETSPSPSPTHIRQSGQQLPSSLPGLTPDVARISNSDNETTPGGGPSLSSLHQILIEVRKDLAIHNTKISALQEDVTLTIHHQREILEILETNNQPCTKSSSQQPQTNTVIKKVSRTGRIKQLIQMHYEALFGLPTGSDLPPSPPSSREKRLWLRNEGSEDETDCESIESGASYADCNKTDDDPEDDQYPYSGGPGHPHASQEILKIMHDMLKEVKMPRFRFDLTLKLSHGDNKHCVSVARDIFVRLVQCGEYDGLKPEEKDPDAILLLLTNYAKERYFRK